MTKTLETYIADISITVKKNAEVKSKVESTKYQAFDYYSSGRNSFAPPPEIGTSALFMHFSSTVQVQIVRQCVYLGPTAPSESWLPASLGVPADLAVGEMGGGTTQADRQ